ncbi:MAG: DUF362 domain-containing protein [Gemmatales bacterium]|nr:DUF362 domain-containing protein [Gemmatales bacterium]
MSEHACSRRRFLQESGSWLTGGGLAGALSWGGLLEERAVAQAGSGRPAYLLAAEERFTGRCMEVARPEFSMPGRWPGRVIEVHHPGSIRNGRAQLEPVRQMVARGMQMLTGADHAADAWKTLFQKGDRVAIKVNPVGLTDGNKRGAITHFELLVAIIDGLKSAGLTEKDIVLYERYADQFRDAGYEKFLQRQYPAITWYASHIRYHNQQTDLEGRDPDSKTGKRPDPDPRVLGYHPEVFRRLPYAMPKGGPEDRPSENSHLSRIITDDIVNKVIVATVLKDHRSSGVTMSLKDMSHGFVNNVARSHMGPSAPSPELDNTCGTFIPEMVSLEPLRKKVVLLIMDGLVGCYEGGPGTWNATWDVWERKSLFFATDPVALDHVGWHILDQYRVSRGWPPVADMGTEKNDPRRAEQFRRRQPEHVRLAGEKGLGIFEPTRIEYRRIQLP